MNQTFLFHNQPVKWVQLLFIANTMCLLQIKTYLNGYEKNLWICITSKLTEQNQYRCISHANNHTGTIAWKTFIPLQNTIDYTEFESNVEQNVELSYLYKLFFFIVTWIYFRHMFSYVLVSYTDKQKETINSTPVTVNHRSVYLSSCDGGHWLWTSIIKKKINLFSKCFIAKYRIYYCYLRWTALSCWLP